MQVNDRVMLIPRDRGRHISLPKYTPAVGDTAIVYPGQDGQHFLVETTSASIGLKYPIINGTIAGRHRHTRCIRTIEDLQNIKADPTGEYVI